MKTKSNIHSIHQESDVSVEYCFDRIKTVSNIQISFADCAGDGNLNLYSNCISSMQFLCVSLPSIKFFQKNLHISKNIPTFASNLSLRATFQVFIVAAFFVSACKSNSIDCCSLTGSRCKALLSLSNDGVQQSFFINSFLISQMRATVRNASKAKHSTLTSTLSGAKSARIPAITVRTGKVKRPKNLLLGEVLNYIDTAGSRQLQVIYNACGGRVSNGKVGRVAV